MGSLVDEHVVGKISPRQAGSPLLPPVLGDGAPPTITDCSDGPIRYLMVFDLRQRDSVSRVKIRYW